MCFYRRKMTAKLSLWLHDGYLVTLSILKTLKLENRADCGGLRRIAVDCGGLRRMAAEGCEWLLVFYVTKKLSLLASFLALHLLLQICTRVQADPALKEQLK